VFSIAILLLLFAVAPALVSGVNAAPDYYYHHKGGVPPGLIRAWAHTNMSVEAKEVTQAIFLSGYHGVQLERIEIEESNNDQMIRNVALNETVLHIKCDKDGEMRLRINSSVKPNAVFADDMPLAEASSMNGLTPQSEAWFYDQNSHMLVVFADPTSVTVFYMPVQTIIPEFPVALTVLSIAVIVVLMTTRALTGKRVCNTVGELARALVFARSAKLVSMV
jgi:hypothetical protein